MKTYVLNMVSILLKLFIMINLITFWIMSELKPMFNNCVLMNDNAIHNQAVMNVLQSLADDNFEFKSIDSSSYNISDRD